MLRHLSLKCIAAGSLGVGCLSTGSSAFAAPNGYTQIPIAKVFGNGVAAFSLSLSRIGTSNTVETTQYGLFNEFEVGLDYQSSPSYDQTFLGNAKYLIVDRPGRLPDIACGITNVATGQRAQPYVVATTQPGTIGVSLGATRPAIGGFTAMGGVAYNLNPNLELVTDYLDGRANYATFGVIAAVTPTVSVNLAYARPNQSGGSGGNPQGFVVNVAYVFHALHKRGGSTGNGGTNKNPAGAAGG